MQCYMARYVKRYAVYHYALLCFRCGEVYLRCSCKHAATCAADHTRAQVRLPDLSWLILNVYQMLCLSLEAEQESCCFDSNFVTLFSVHALHTQQCRSVQKCWRMQSTEKAHLLCACILLLCCTSSSAASLQQHNNSRAMDRAAHDCCCCFCRFLC